MHIDNDDLIKFENGTMEEDELIEFLFHGNGKGADDDEVANSHPFIFKDDRVKLFHVDLIGINSHITHIDGTFQEKVLMNHFFRRFILMADRLFFNMDWNAIRTYEARPDNRRYEPIFTGAVS